jgi:hypothetical protein
MSQKQKIALLAALLVIGGAVWVWQYWPPSGEGKTSSTAFLQGYQPLNFPNPDLHWSVLERRRKAEYKPSGINPFSHEVPPSAEEVRKAEEARLKAQEAAQTTAAQQQQMQQQNVELPANMKFFGYGTVPTGTPRRAFLSYQDEVFIVREGDTLMGRYRILKINNASLEFEEVGSGRRGQKMLEDQGPNA